MKRSTMAALLVLAVGILAMGTVYASSQLSENYYLVKVSIQDGQPKVGANPVVVEVRDTAGNLVADADVRIRYDMEGMNHDGKTIVKAGEGRGTLDFSMPGEWIIDAKVVKAGKVYTASSITNVVR